MKKIKIGLIKIAPTKDIQDQEGDRLSDYTQRYFRLYIADEFNFPIDGLKSSDFAFKFLLSEHNQVLFNSVFTPDNSSIPGSALVNGHAGNYFIRLWQLNSRQASHDGLIATIEFFYSDWLEVTISNAEFSGDGMLYLG